MAFCDDAIEDFCDRHWPCEFSSLEGRCSNVKSGHSSKGHQLRNGKSFGSGPYQSRFSAESYVDTWKCKIHHHLELLLNRLREAHDDYESEELVASRIHKEFILTPFFQHVKACENYVSHSTCFSCLTAPPEHMLPCSHVICTPCLQAYGVTKGKVLIEVTSCPLLHDRPMSWNKPWQVIFKVRTSAVNVLCFSAVPRRRVDGPGVEEHA